MIDLDQMLSPTPTRWAAARDRGREAARAALERSPRFYVRLAQRRNPHRELIDRSTDVVIEGFPRSGNTFLLSWITLSNPQLEVASHLHSIAHVDAALRQRTPVILLLRNPKDAVASELINKLGRGRTTSPLPLFRRYERFYQGALRYLDDLIVSPFETTTVRPELVISTLSEQMGTALGLEPPQKEDGVLADVERINTLHVGEPNELTVARPSESRAELATRVKSYLVENHASTLAGLQDLHDRLATSPAAVRPADSTG